MDNLISRAWWACVMAMIVVTATAGVALAYRSIFALIGSNWQTAVLQLVAGAVLSVAAYALCCVRGDLLGER